MTKSEQNKINIEVEKMQEACYKELQSTVNNEYIYPWYMSGKSFGKRLDYCQAYVMSTENYFILKSYETIVACVDKDSGVMYDWLRLVYGYTASSAKHISKFRNQYAWNCYPDQSLTWRNV